MSLRIVFMGSPDFALPSLSALVSAPNYQVVGVITQPDRASGRGRELKPPPVKSLALDLNIPVMQPEKLRLPEPMEQLRAWAPDLIVVAAFGQILKKDVLEMPHYGCINVHASLLPRWRGAAPINAAILHGDEETGVTIMQMDVGLDTGPMLAKKSIRIKPDDTAGSVSQALSTLGADLLIETLPDYLAGNLTATPQPEDGSTYAPMLKKTDGLLDFTQPAVDLGTPCAGDESVAGRVVRVEWESAQGVARIHCQRRKRFGKRKQIHSRRKTRCSILRRRAGFG